MFTTIPVDNSVRSPSLESPGCIHCGNPVRTEMESSFCCTGCKTVYTWIQSHQLGEFYAIKNKTRSVRSIQPPLSHDESFAYLDDPEFLESYARSTKDGLWIDFYLDGVHCAACVWLTEQITEFVEHVGFIRLNLGTSVATVKIDPGGSFSKVAAAFQEMGYTPHPIKPDQHHSFQKAENRLLLVRLGVAGACSGNIMLLAVSLYAGADGPLGHHFRWISLLLFLPVIIFSAIPFYQSAWSSLQRGMLSIDVPVVLGILIGSLVSTVNLLTGDGRIYFDSLSALVFLLLSTRYLMKRTQQSALASSRLIQFLLPNSVRKWNPTTHSFELTKTAAVKVGDRIQVLPNESIPMDGILLKGESTLDCSLLTGESLPVEVIPGCVVFAGTLNLNSLLELEVTQSGTNTRVGRILDSIEAILSKKAKIAVFSDKMSRYFVGSVVILSGLALTWGAHGDWRDGMNRALAIAIVTCPCTFALITPLAFSLTLGRLARRGVLVKGPDVLEKLARIQSVFVDKTGTLTVGLPQVVHWDVPTELATKIMALELQSTHPIAKAIVNYLKTSIIDEGLNVQKVKETMGSGIQGQVEDTWIELRKSPNPATGKTEVSVLKNGALVGRITLTDQLRPDSAQAVSLLQTLHLTPWILSGDHLGSVLEVAAAVGIAPENCIANALPEKKREIIQQHPHALMVGDGANDAIALAQADVGIAVRCGVEISLRAADIYLNTQGLLPLYSIIVIARETVYVVKRNFVFSIFYNLIAGGFALAGAIDPLVAAILMPISALTVLLSSLFGTSKLRVMFRQLEKGQQ